MFINEIDAFGVPINPNDIIKNLYHPFPFLHTIFGNKLFYHSKLSLAERQVEALVKACGQSKLSYDVSDIDDTTDLPVVSASAAGHFVSITRREGSHFGLRT